MLRTVLRTTDWHEREGVQNRWFWVVVHDTAPELVAAAARMGRPVEADCKGVVHPVWQRERIGALPQRGRRVDLSRRISLTGWADTGRRLLLTRNMLLLTGDKKWMCGEVSDGTVTPLEPANGYAGLIRLARTHLTVEVVAHELVHAAVVVYRQCVHPQVSLGNGCRRNEEALAYIYGDLAASMAVLLRDHQLTVTVG